jgi:Ca2+:H+ antiporter
LAKVPSADDEDAELDELSQLTSSLPMGQSGTTESPAAEDEITPTEIPVDVDEDDLGAISDAESFTLKDRQDAINVTHPFGIRIWKPALYKKNRSVQKSAEDEIHSTPGLNVHPWIALFNFAWTIIFGWWLSILCLVGALLCFIFGILSRDSVAYGRVLLGLSKYLLFPFGKFVKLLQDEAYAEEDEGEGRSISEYEQWQSGDIEEGRLFFGPMSRSLIGRRRTSIESTDETQSLLGRHRRGEQMESVTNGQGQKTRLFGRGTWNLGRVVFFLYFHLVVTPFLLFVCLLCWFMVFSIPMGKVTWIVWDHLRRHPLALSFHSQSSDTRQPGEPPSSILVCTYRAVGSKYWKFTIDGTNIFLFNLLAIVGFTIFDYYVLAESLHLDLFLTSQGLLFCLALFSIIPLAYFIGQAVASISAQSSMGVGATVNAFFSTIVEVFLYCVALSQGKAQLVEGSIIGSIFAGILFLPGLSMCFGALKRKTQRFNVKSAGVTSTMMLFAMIGAFGPTLFYQIYGSVSLLVHIYRLHSNFDSMNSNVTNAIIRRLTIMPTVDVASSHKYLLCMIDSTPKLCCHISGFRQLHYSCLM